jgi:hypothetical protein
MQQKNMMEIVGQLVESVVTQLDYTQVQQEHKQQV